MGQKTGKQYQQNLQIDRIFSDFIDGKKCLILNFWKVHGPINKIKFYFKWWANLALKIGVRLH